MGRGRDYWTLGAGMARWWRRPSCAAPHFALAGEFDGTQDYHWTSEKWFAEVRRKMKSWRLGPRIAARLLKHFLRHPRHATTMYVCLLVAESWQWQFRGEKPPARLLRQVWEAKGEG